MEWRLAAAFVSDGGGLPGAFRSARLHAETPTKPRPGIVVGLAALVAAFRTLLI